MVGCYVFLARFTVCSPTSVLVKPVVAQLAPTGVPAEANAGDTSLESLKCQPRAKRRLQNLPRIFGGSFVSTKGMLRLADTSIRMYRRKDGRVSLRLLSYLMVNAMGSGFRLSTYIRNLNCQVTFPDGRIVELDDVGWGYDMECEIEMDTMVHKFSAAGITDMDMISDGVALLRMDYTISFTGHPSEKPGFFEAVVPMIARSTVYGVC